MSEIRSAQPVREKPARVSVSDETVLDDAARTFAHEMSEPSLGKRVDKPRAQDVKDTKHERDVLNIVIEALGSLAPADRKRILDSALKFLGD